MADNPNSIDLEITPKIVSNQDSKSSAEKYAELVGNLVGQKVNDSLSKELTKQSTKKKKAYQQAVAVDGGYVIANVEATPKQKKITKATLAPEHNALSRPLNEQEKTDYLAGLTNFKKIKATQNKEIIDSFKAHQKELEIEQKVALETQKATRHQEMLNALIDNATGKEKLKLQIIAKENELKKLQKNYDEGNFGELTKKDTLKKIVDVNKQVTKLKNELNGVGKSGKKLNAVTRMFNTIKRVGFYRVARSLFSAIEQGLSQASQKLAEFDKDYNYTIRQIQSSKEVISSSFVLGFSTILESVLPMIKDLATGAANIANNFSKASAALKGQTKYLAVNENYLKEMVDSANSFTLSFDKFESLEFKESPYEYRDMTQEEMEEAKTSEYANILTLIREIFAKIWDVIKQLLTILKPIFDFIFENIDTILNLVLNLLDVLPSILDLLDDILTALIDTGILNVLIKMIEHDVKKFVFTIMLLVTIVRDIFLAIKFIILAIVNIIIWVVKTVYNIAVGIINAIIFVINCIIDVLNVAADLINKVINFFGGNSNLGIKKLQYMDTYITSYEPMLFANGGLVDSGSLFVAGEAGAELVTTMPSGQTGVTNIAQFKQAMVEALYEWSAGQPEGGGDIILYLDGAEVARSKRFVGELNRKNAGLNLR